VKQWMVLLPLLGCSLAWGLSVGDAAPALVEITLVRGEIPAWERQWTVVEFWATWCAPCRKSIPHLSDLQRQYADKVAILGLSDEAEKTVREYVAKQGDAMAYAVGIAAAGTRDAYMAGQSGIPRAFLVSPEGKIAWIGHPSALDPILEEALLGALNVDVRARLLPLENALKGALQSRSPDMIAEAADALLQADPVHRDALRIRVALARQQGDVGAARGVYERVSRASLTPDQTASLAAALLAEGDLRFRFPDLAKELVDRIAAADPGSFRTLMLAARWCYTSGRLDEAIALQTRAAALDPDGAGDLEYYRAVKGLAPPQP